MYTTQRFRRVTAFLMAATMATGTAFANPPSWAGGHKGGRDEAHGDGGKGGKHHAGPQVRNGAYFSDHNRDAVRHYYVSHPGKGCPPGLAKKNNGCLPPGQAKKLWAVGEPLPTTVVITPVPQQIIVTLPPVPVGHRYVEVAGDILLIATGTKMVVDGINGLSGR